MSDTLALLALIFGFTQIALTIKAIRQVRHEPKRFYPRFTAFILLFGSSFGLILVFIGLDIIFKWI